MIVFPIQSLMDEQACYEYLLSVLHPHGLHCPQGHPLPASQGAHDRHRTPIVDYRCKTCGAVFNLFTNTIWSKTRYGCATIVLLLRGVAQGVPTAHLAGELGIDRAHLLEHRHEMQKLLEQSFPPDPAAGAGDGGR
jgi:transposase-like protein